MALTFERHEGGIINEFRLLNNLKDELRAIFSHTRRISPVQKVVIVYHTTTEVRLKKRKKHNYKYSAGIKVIIST